MIASEADRSGEGVDADGKSDRTSAPGPTERPSPPRVGDVGNVLRTAFQATVDEAVPDEMLELLRRLT